MKDEDFYIQFENATLDANIFNHSNHIKMAWIYLQKFDLPEAISKFSKDLKAFAAANGAPKLYHETITFAFLILINERLKANETQRNWGIFKETNPDLFDRQNNILKKYYREKTINSAFAKKIFVFPDKI